MTALEDVLTIQEIVTLRHRYQPNYHLALAGRAYLSDQISLEEYEREIARPLEKLWDAEREWEAL